MTKLANSEAASTLRGNDESRQPFKNSEAQSSDLIQKALQRFRQTRDRIKPVQIERETAEAMLNWELVISATETLVEIRKTLVSVAIELHDMGAVTPSLVDEVKQGLANETSRLSALKQSYSPQVPRETLTYDGRTIDEWFSILETERSPDRLKTALDAIKQLGQERDSQKVVGAIMRLARIYGYKGGQFDLFDKARGIFNGVPKEIVVDAVLNELKAPNQNSGNFLTQFPFWFRVMDYTTRKASFDPEFVALLADRSELLQSQLFNIIDAELASAQPEHLEWSVSLLINLLTEFEFFKPNDQEALIERISKAIPLIQAVNNKVWLVDYLTKAGVDTSRFEDMLLEALILKDLPAGYAGSAISPYSNLVFETLKEMGPEHTSQKTVDAITKLLSDDKYWQGSTTNFLGNIPLANHPKTLAIELLGSFGEKAASALPVLKKIAANKDDPYKEAATKAMIEITVPGHAREDALHLQGRWKSMNASEDSTENVGPFMVVVDGLSLARFGGPFRMDAAGPERDKLRIGIGSKTIEFN